MANPELSITVGELLGIAKVSLSGRMGSCHDHAVLGILAGFREQGATSLVLDVAGLAPSGVDAATGLIRVLRSLGPSVCIHVVASDALGVLLRKGGFGPCVKVYSSTDEIYDHVGSETEYLTSRWISPDTQDNELPLAA